MAAGDLLHLPGVGTTSNYTKAASAWGNTGPLTLLIAGSNTNNRTLYAVTFQTTTVPTIDTTIQILLELYIDGVVMVQLPFSFRSDTAVGYYMTKDVELMLPEPFYIPSGTLIQYQITDSTTAATQFQGVQFIFREEAAVVSYTPVDPIGMMGIFGI